MEASHPGFFLGSSSVLEGGLGRGDRACPSACLRAHDRRGAGRCLYGMAGSLPRAWRPSAAAGRSGLRPHRCAVEFAVHRQASRRHRALHFAGRHPRLPALGPGEQSAFRRPLRRTFVCGLFHHQRSAARRLRHEPNHLCRVDGSRPLGRRRAQHQRLRRAAPVGPCHHAREVRGLAWPGSCSAAAAASASACMD